MQLGRGEVGEGLGHAVETDFSGDEGCRGDLALREVAQRTVFTTHTPLSAGTDVFPFPLFEKYFSSHYDKFGTDRNGLLQLGTNPANPDAGFNMTVFALRMSNFCNAVSKKHGEVAREMWKDIWPDKKVEDVPITNRSQTIDAVACVRLPKPLSLTS